MALPLPCSITHHEKVKPAHIQPARHPASHAIPCPTSLPGAGPCPGSPLGIPKTSQNPCCDRASGGEG